MESTYPISHRPIHIKQNLPPAKYAWIPIASPMKIVLVNIMIPINNCPGHQKTLGFSGIARLPMGHSPIENRIRASQPLPRPRLAAEITEAKGFMFNLRAVQKSTGRPAIIFFGWNRCFVVVNGNELEVLKCVFHSLLKKIHEDTVCFSLKGFGLEWCKLLFV